MPQDVHAIQPFFRNSGRLDLYALESFANEHSEQEFVRLLQVPVLMGNEVLQGELSSRSGDASTFFPTDPSINKRPIQSRPPLMHLIFPFIKQTSTGNPDFFSIGFGENNDFILPDYTVSTVQAGIRRTGANRYLLRNAPSTNPTLINGRSHEKTEVFLHDDDRLTFGRYEFLFLTPSALYYRLKGIELKVRIQNFLDSLGKADHDALKNYAIRHGQEMFEQLIANPSLVGFGLFRGYSLDRASEDIDTTMAFLPDLTFGSEARHMKMLERAIYPLIPPDVADVSTPTLRIGRSESNDIIMPEGSISNQHATIEIPGPGHYRIHDLESTNGTFINDRPTPAQGQDLLDGQRIKLGRFEFLFLFPGSLYFHMTPANIRRP
ncbi:MAG: hypothetical protein HW380_923 [Magnetococcales bacterium]|nr:hypothetical protein [Magnetococcales bacterium]HIJ84276.1 FHA domain-containing protein [Magnetococcales bacterium]